MIAVGEGPPLIGSVAGRNCRRRLGAWLASRRVVPPGSWLERVDDQNAVRAAPRDAGGGPERKGMLGGLPLSHTKSRAKTRLLCGPSPEAIAACRDLVFEGLSKRVLCRELFAEHDGSRWRGDRSTVEVHLRQLRACIVAPSNLQAARWRPKRKAVALTSAPSEHQSRAIAGLRRSLPSGHKRPMLQMPTGAGKTLTSAHIVSGALDKGKRVAFVFRARPWSTRPSANSSGKASGDRRHAGGSSPH